MRKRGNPLLWLAFFALCAPGLCFSQQFIITGGVPHKDSPGQYRLQVGAFRTAPPAESTFERLKNGGLNPVYEQYGDFRRVVIAGLKAGDIPSYIDRIKDLGFQEVWVREDTYDERWRRVFPSESPTQTQKTDAPQQEEPYQYEGDDKDDYIDFLNIVVRIIDQGVLKIHSRTRKDDGSRIIDYAYTDSATGEKKTFSTDTNETEQIYWEVE